MFDLSEIPISQFRKVLFLFKKKVQKATDVYLWVESQPVSSFFPNYFFLMWCKMGLITWSWRLVKSVKNEKNWTCFVYVNVWYICFLTQDVHETPVYSVIMRRRNCIVCKFNGRWISFQTILWFLLWSRSDVVTTSFCNVLSVLAQETNKIHYHSNEFGGIFSNVGAQTSSYKTDHQ